MDVCVIAYTHAQTTEGGNTDKSCSRAVGTGQADKSCHSPQTRLSATRIPSLAATPYNGMDTL